MNLKSVIKPGIGAAALLAMFAGSQGAYAQTTYNVNVTPATQTVNSVNGGTTTITVVGNNTTNDGTPSQPTLANLGISAAGTASDFSNVPFTLSISVTNNTTNATTAAQNEVVRFANGTNASGNGNTSTFPTPSFSGPLTFMFGSGASATFVNLNNFTFFAPTASGGTNNGAVGATISNGAAPEPGALVLALPGLLGVVAMVRRRKSA